MPAIHHDSRWIDVSNADLPHRTGPGINPKLQSLEQRVWRGASWVATTRVSYVEAHAGLARACRIGRISAHELREAVERLETFHRQMHHVEITADLVARAGNLAEGAARRAYDAVQLAAALSLDRDDLVVITGDRQLAAAAQSVGLASICDPGAPV